MGCYLPKEQHWLVMRAAWSMYRVSEHCPRQALVSSSSSAQTGSRLQKAGGARGEMCPGVRWSDSLLLGHSKQKPSSYREGISDEDSSPAMGYTWSLVLNGLETDFFLCVARLVKTRLSFPPPSKYCRTKSVTWRCCNIKTLRFIGLVQGKGMAKTQSTQWKSWQWASIPRVMAIPQPSAAKICVWAEEHYQHFKKRAKRASSSGTLDLVSECAWDLRFTYKF